MDRLALFIATCGYLGYAPIAPGTVGSVAGLIVLWAIRNSALPAVEIATIVLVLLLGVWSATAAERHFGRIDPAPIVIDEVAGMPITLAFLPFTARAAVCGFLIFRVLDTIKPWLSRQFEALRGGLGVMADDAMAGVYANLVVRGVIVLAPGWIA